jgi:hypothetical protein
MPQNRIASLTAALPATKFRFHSTKAGSTWEPAFAVLLLPKLVPLGLPHLVLQDARLDSSDNLALQVRRNPDHPFLGH